MEQVIILGAGTMAQEVTDLINDIGQDEVVGYCVNQGWKKDLTLLGKKVYYVDDLIYWLDRAKVIRAIFSPESYGFIKKVENMGFDFTSVIHPSASISKSAKIGKGVIVNRLVAIGYGTVISSHCLINRGCTIGHHCFLEEGVTLGPGVNIAGNVQVGKRTLIGMGSNVIQNAIIGSNRRIRANSLVLK